MADTGERRQISVRANANEAETIRSSRKLIDKEQSKTDASNAAFRTVAKDVPRPGKAGKQPSRTKHA